MGESGVFVGRVKEEGVAEFGWFYWSDGKFPKRAGVSCKQTDHQSGVGPE